MSNRERKNRRHVLATLRGPYTPRHSSVEKGRPREGGPYRFPAFFPEITKTVTSNDKICDLRCTASRRSVAAHPNNQQFTRGGILVPLWHRACQLYRRASKRTEGLKRSGQRGLC